MKYFNRFSSVEDVRAEFSNESRYSDNPTFADVELRDDEVLFASYSAEGYEGDAFVLFRRDGKLYEVHGSHCSCYGLEGQWAPEETTVEVLAMRRAGYSSEMAQIVSPEYHGDAAARAVLAAVGLLGESAEGARTELPRTDEITDRRARDHRDFPLRRHSRQRRVVSRVVVRRMKPVPARPGEVATVKVITFEVRDEHAPALRSAIDDIRQRVGKELEGMHKFAREAALTNASIALAQLASAVNQQVPKGDSEYAGK